MTDAETPLPLQRRALMSDLVRRMIRDVRDEKPELKQEVEVTSTDGRTTEKRPLYKVLDELASVVWLRHEGKPTAQEQARADQLTQDLARIDPSLHVVVADVMAHASQLHQMAGLLARESVMNLSARKDENNPVRKMLFKMQRGGVGAGRVFATAQDAVAAIAGTSFEATFTGHPTNTNSIASMQTQRTAAAATIAFATAENQDRKEAYAKAQQALIDFAKTPLLPMKNGVPTKLSVAEETQTMLYFLGNAYDDLPQTYGQFDEELKQAYGEEYRPKDLKLGLKFHSWGSSGDKDGNSNVNGDTTLQALAAHKAEIYGRYARDLEALGVPLMGDDVAHLKKAAAEAANAVSSIQIMLEHKDQLSPQEFSDISKQISVATQMVDLPRVMQTLEQKIEKAPAEQQQPMLNLLRRMRTFGEGFGTIEYRETAEEYTRVVEKLIPHYEQMDEAARCAKISELLKHPQQLHDLAATLYADIQGKYTKPYSPTDRGPIAYQTLKRMELARDFPETFQNNVLAECKNTSNILEALLLQHAVMKDGKRPKMGIVPLFEDHETLKKAPEIVRGALHNPYYFKHLLDVSLARNVPPTQQIQLAHSDNFKRAGIAARALIARAHEELRDVLRDFSKGLREGHIFPEVFEGGVAGVTQDGRKHYIDAIDALVEKGLKMEFFEGGSQSDCIRGGGRAISATINAFGLHDFAKMTFQGGDLLNFFNLPQAAARLFTHNISNCVKRANSGEPRRRLSERDQKIIDAFDVAKKSYIGLFNSEEFRKFINCIDYAEVTQAGNYSSRAANRTGSGELVNIDKARAIGWSETMQHSDFVATWVGVQNIEQELEKKIKGAQLPETRKKLYAESPIYSDMIDRMMHGLMRTDMAYVREKSRLEDGQENPLMETFHAQYVEAFRLCIESYTGQPAEKFLQGKDPNAMVYSGELRNIIKQEVYPHVKDVLGDQERLVKLVHSMETWDKNALTEVQKNTFNSLLHNTLDTIHHGRLPLVDDPTYAREFCHVMKIDRPWVDDAKQQGRAA